MAVILLLQKEDLKRPKWNQIKEELIIRVRKVYEKEVEYVNSVIIKEAHEGVAFRDKNRVRIPISPNAK